MSSGLLCFLEEAAVPFGDKCQYSDFAACVAANGDKDDPDAYCAALQQATEEHCKVLALAPQRAIDFSAPSMAYVRMLKGIPQTLRRDKPAQTFHIEPAVTKVVDMKAGRIHAIVSTEAKDRHGDIVRQDGWDLKHFMNHPVLLSSHDYQTLKSQIGKWEEMQVRGKRLEGVARYYVGEGNDEADWAFNLATKGDAAYSVGFNPDMHKAKEIKSDDEWSSAWEFNGQELLEVSQVTVPANADALQILKSGTVNPVLSDMIDRVMQYTPKLGDLDAVTDEVLERLMREDRISTLLTKLSQAGDERRRQDDAFARATKDAIRETLKEALR